MIKAGEKWYSTVSSPASDTTPVNMSYWLPKIEKYTEKVWEQAGVNILLNDKLKILFSYRVEFSFHSFFILSLILYVFSFVF